MKSSTTSTTNNQTANQESATEVKRQVMPEELRILAKLDRMFAELPILAQLRCLSWLESKYGMEVRYTLNEENNRG
jgi:hypothetical protein